MLFLKKYPHIFKIKAKDGSVIHFKPNQTQKHILEEIDKDLKAKGRSRLIIIKGRQAGITTLFQLLGLSYAMSKKAFNCYTMAHDSTTATDIFDQKIKFAFDNLPPTLKSLYSLKKDNTRQLMFDKEMQKSTITVGTSARGTTQNFLHISEAGKMSERKQAWDEMISGTLQASKQADIIVIESTADGGLGTFYEMTQKALNGDGEFRVVFISWTDTEEYQTTPPDNQEWKNKYLDLTRRYKLYEDPITTFGITENQLYWYYQTVIELGEEVKVQYPFTLEEAFISKAKNKFDINQVKNLEIKTPVKTIDGVKIYRLPDEEEQLYCLGIDPSTGLGEDFTAMTLRGFYKRDGVYPLYAQMRLKMPPLETARVCVNLANYYGRTIMIPERNGVGQSVLDQLRLIYPNELIYQSRDDNVASQHDIPIAKYGWSTDGNTRYRMIDSLANLFHNNELEVINQEERDEMLVFVWNDGNQRYEAQEGKHDDLVMSDAICIAGFDYINKYI
jgi:hypothetical protein